MHNVTVIDARARERVAAHKMQALEAVLWPAGDLDHDAHLVATIQQLRRLSELLGSHEDHLVAQADGLEPAAEFAPGKRRRDLSDAKTLRAFDKQRAELIAMVWDVYRELDRVAKDKMQLLNNIDLIGDELSKFASLFLPKVGALHLVHACIHACIHTHTHTHTHIHIHRQTDIQTHTHTHIHTHTHTLRTCFLPFLFIQTRQ